MASPLIVSTEALARALAPDGIHHDHAESANSAASLVAPTFCTHDEGQQAFILRPNKPPSELSRQVEPLQSCGDADSLLPLRVTPFCTQFSA